MSDWIAREKERRQQGPFRIGTVVAVSDAEGLDVTVGGGVITGLQYLDSYSAPGVGDVVALLYSAGQYFVMGKFGTTGLNLGPNLLPNAGFELGTPGATPSSWNDFWSTNNTLRALRVDDEALAHSSGASAQFESGELTTGQQIRLSMTDAITVTPGSTYRVGAWFRGSVADSNLTVAVNVHTAATSDGAQPFGEGVTSTDVATSTPGTGWAEVAGTRTIPAGHGFLRVFLAVTAAGAPAAQFVYADDVSLRKQI